MSLEDLEIGPPVELTFLAVGEAVETGPGIPGPAGPPGPAGGHAVGIAAVALSGHRAVTPGPGGGWVYASNDEPEHLGAPIWITTGAAAAGAAAEAMIIGPMTEPSWNWIPRQPVYLGTNGVLTQSAPTAPDAFFLAQVGFAISATSLYVDRLPSIKIT